MSLRPQQQRRRRRDREQQRDLERGNVETLESQLPKYDPSTFHHKNEYSIDSTRGLSIDLARQSFMMDNRYQHHRNSSQVSGVVPPPPPGPAPGRGSTSMEMTSPLDMSRGASPTEGAGAAHSNTDSPTPMLQGSRGGIRGTFKGPKKPKPVLTRLITNL